MDFSYEQTFREESPEAYERLLLDALLGDPTLFIRTDEVEQCWRIVDPIIEHWANDHVADPDLRGRLLGPDRRRPADRPQRPQVAQRGVYLRDSAVHPYA